MKKIKIKDPQQLNLFEQYENTINGLHSLSDGDPEPRTENEIFRPLRENAPREPDGDGLHVRVRQGEVSENTGFSGGAEQSDPSGDGLRQDEISIDRGGDGAGRGARDSLGSAVKPVGPFVDFRREPQYSNKASFNKKEALEDNCKALEVLIASRNRVCTPEEQEILSRYKGWGALKVIGFNPTNDDFWQTQEDISLRDLVKRAHELFGQLDDKGVMLGNAIASTLNAHYTKDAVINAIYHGLSAGGFNHGKILEPAAGIGNFFSVMPKEMFENSTLSMVEIDTVSSMIAQKLHPNAAIYNKPFQEANFLRESYDLIVSNVPFGDYKVFDRDLGGEESIHNYYFLKSLDLVRPDGLVAFITSRFTMDSEESQTRRKILEKSDFLGAVRLPANTFLNNAGTQVVTDIVFLKKHGIHRVLNAEINNSLFINTLGVELTDGGNTATVPVNKYYLQSDRGFVETNSRMIGEPTIGGMYSGDTFNLKSSYTDASLGEQIKKILTEHVFKEKIYFERNEEIKEPNEIILSIEATQEDENKLVVLEHGGKSLMGNVGTAFFINEEYDKAAVSAGLNPNRLREDDAYAVASADKLKLINLTRADFLRYRFMARNDVSEKDIIKAKYYVGVRDCLEKLLDAEYSDVEDSEIEKLRGELNVRYDKFFVRYGAVNHKNNSILLELDGHGSLASVMENVKKEGKKMSYSKADIFYKRTIKAKLNHEQVKSLNDAIIVCLDNKGAVDMDFISSLLQRDKNEILESESKADNPLIFQTPTGEAIDRLAYLSGDVVEKLALAKQWAEEDSRFEVNVRSLNEVMPKRVNAVSIPAPIESKWINVKHKKDFLCEILSLQNIELTQNVLTKEYAMPGSYNFSADQYKTVTRAPNWVINHFLNGQEPEVTRIEKYADGTTKTVVDVEDTMIAKSKVETLRRKWDDFKYKNLNRRSDIEDTFNRLFNNIVNRTFDGSKCNFENLAGFTLAPHQRDAVYRFTTTRGGLMDHIVGGGKTLIMVATAMELRRLSIAHKPLIIGLKAQLPNFVETFKKAYPTAKVLMPSQADFEVRNRERLLNRMATNDWDCIVLTHEQFGMIKQPESYQKNLMLDSLHELEMGLNDPYLNKRERGSILKQIQNKQAALQELMDFKKDKNHLDFAQLGIDFLMVDESQMFKNLEFTTAKKNVRGLGSPKGSKRAFNLLVACRYLQGLHGGDKGVLFSSGTPVSNTMAEMYLLFKYLMPNELSKQKINTFDDWATTFASVSGELELNAGGKYQIVNRMRQFVCLPQLMNLYKSIADVRNDLNLKLDKPAVNTSLISVEPNEEQLECIEKLQQYIETKGHAYRKELGLEKGYDAKKMVNSAYGILATNFAKKLSVDPRMVGGRTFGNKLTMVTDNISKIFNETENDKGVQLVFSDIGTPNHQNMTQSFLEYIENAAIFNEADLVDLKKLDKMEAIREKLIDLMSSDESDVDKFIESAKSDMRFNIYDEMKHLLVSKGIPSEQIVYIHDYDNREDRENLFAQVNRGEVRVILGSTIKLGTGVNVQQRGVALHHVDMPWRPSDVEQRNGRFVRQYNEVAKKLGNKVDVFFYATKRTLDAMIYNLVHQKSAYINAVKIQATDAAMSDLNIEMDYGMMAAELSDNPLYKEREEVKRDVKDLEMKQAAFMTNKYNTESTIRSYQTRKEVLANVVTIYEKGEKRVREIPLHDGGKESFVANINGKAYDKPGLFGEVLLARAKAYLKDHQNDHHGAALLGEANGFDVYVMFDNNNFNRVITNKNNPNEVIQRKAFSDSGIGVGLSIQTAISAIPDQLKKYEDEVAMLTSNIEKIKGVLTEDSPFVEELGKKSQRLAELDNAIKKELEKEKKIRIQEGNGLSENTKEGGMLNNHVHIGKKFKIHL